MNKVISFFSGLSQTTWILIGIGLVLLIFLIIYLNSKKTVDGVSANKDLKSNLNSFTPRPVFPLQYGSTGEEVKSLQRYLKSKGANLGNFGPGMDGVDGEWGPKTEAAVKSILNVTTVSKELFSTLK